MSDEWQQWAKDSILIPNLPLAKSRALSRARLGRAGIDVSDGLGADLKRLCDASHVGAVVEARRIPVESPAREVAAIMRIEPWALAFGCGGDFQFLVTTPREALPEVEGLGFHLIGELTDGDQIRLRLPDGAEVPLPEGGHRDARNTSFAEEILALVKVAAGVTKA
jgi:thiamine-monophosphate kinase